MNSDNALPARPRIFSSGALKNETRACSVSTGALARNSEVACIRCVILQDVQDFLADFSLFLWLDLAASCLVSSFLGDALRVPVLPA